MAYKPFPIYDMKTGKVEAREPWLIPRDAFKTIRGGYLKRGVLEKRRGTTIFGQIVSVNTATKVPTLATNPVMGIVNYFNGDVETLLVMDQNRVNKFESNVLTGVAITAFADGGGGQVVVSAVNGFADDDIVTITGVNDNNGTFNVQNSTANDFEITDTFVATGTGLVSQEQFVDLTRHSVRYKGKAGQNYTPLVNEVLKGATSGAIGTVKSNIVDSGSVGDEDAAGTIIFQNGSITGTFQANEELQQNGTPANIAGQSDTTNAASDDEFTGDNTEFFQIENWNDVGYLTNDNDIIRKYNGTDLSRFHIDLDVEGGPDNDVSRCRLIFKVRSRLVIFDTTERGVRKRQRGRFSNVESPGTWSDDDFQDCPTEAVITGGAWLGNELYIFFANGAEGGEVWRWTYQHDRDLPFAWDRIDNSEGGFARGALVETKVRGSADQIVTISQENLIGMDGVRAFTIDNKIPDFVMSWLQNSVAYSQGFLLKTERQVLISYASEAAQAHADGNIYPDSILYLNYDDLNWATAVLDVHSFGKSRLESSLTFADISEAFEDVDFAPDDVGLQAGSPTNLYGNHAGKVFRLNNSLSDDGSAILFDVVTADLNPFVLEGFEARLGYIEFLCSVDDAASFAVQSFLDNDSASFQTVTVTCEAVGASKELSWHRLDVNAVGFAHRMEISNNATGNRPRIHAVVPYFERAGRII